MESITIKVEKDLAKEMDKAMKPYYSTKTEFIRDAIRTKLTQLEKDKIVQQLAKFKGAAKVHVSDKRHEEIREEVVREYAKKFGIKLD